MSYTNGKSVAYIYDDLLAKQTRCIPTIGKRSEMVNELINAYDLTSMMDCHPSVSATAENLLTFHSQLYVDFLSSEKFKGNNEKMSVMNGSQDSLNDSAINCSIESQDSFGKGPEAEESQDSQEDEYGLGYDCPPFAGMDIFACRIAGGTLAAVNCLLNGSSAAINWCGGWHHAQRDSASGFCYVNDIVIGIQALQKRFKKILYIDIDAHHGDGVENAFSCSKNIMTVSFHHFETGYFPGTGNINDVGFGRGRYHSVNVPLKSGIVDNDFITVFDGVLELVKEKFNEDAIVMQCGMDGLSGDPLGNFNLTQSGYAHCVKKMLSRNVPILFLGGGGYNAANAARGWTYLTSVILSKEISSEIPEHNSFPCYGPAFELEITRGLRRNENDEKYLQNILSQIKDNLKHIPNPEN